jgi:hypothetical protein
VVVAGAAAGQRGRRGGGAQRPWPVRRRVGGRRLRDEVLEQVRDVRTGQFHVPVPALPPLDHQPARQHPVQVPGRCRRCHAGMAGQLPGRPGPPVEEGDTDGGAGGVGEQAGERGQPGDARIGHDPIVPARRFGGRRSVAA